MIPVMYNSSAKPTPAVNHSLEKNEGSRARKNDSNYRSVIWSLNFLTNPTRPKAQFTVHQCALFGTDPKLPHDQVFKCVLRYLNGVATQGLIMKPDPEKGVECFVGAYFMGGWNQEEGKDPGLVLSRTGYIIMYSDLFQPKTSTFSTRALIWAHFKTVRYFYQPIFSSFSYLKNALHHLVVELCSALFFFKNILQLYINFTHSFVAIELLTFCKNAKKLFYCLRELAK